MGIADIYEITGDYANAAQTYDRIIDLLENEWGLTEETDSSVTARRSSMILSPEASSKRASAM